jgi:endonuclease YncB( thermonuclease family)
MISRASHRSCRSSWSQGLSFVLAIVTSSPTWAAAGLIAGRAAVIDGDTLEIHGERIRLFGIDAPESGQTCLDAKGQRYRCGQKAALVLDARIGEGVVTCERKDTDRYGRTVALCRVFGEDLGAWMVGLGWALASRAYSARYVPAENLQRFPLRLHHTRQRRSSWRTPVV